jgi:hypothetical protein
MDNQKIVITEIDKTVHSIEINETTFLLKNPIDLNLFTEKYYESFSIISDIVDFTSFKEKDKKQEWNEKELRTLLDNSNIIQKCILEVLIVKESILKEDLITEIASLFVKNYNKYGKLKDYTHGEQLSFNNLKGHVAGFKRRVNSLNKEKLFKIKKETYEINNKYLEFLKRLLNE